jgi:hypothetical protein
VICGLRFGIALTAEESEKVMLFLSCLMQVSSVTMSLFSPRNTAPPCLPLGIKDLLKEDARFFGFWLLDEGRLLEGKRIAEGKELLKGK